MTGDSPSGRLPVTRYDHDRDGLAALLEDQPGYRVDQLWQGLYRDLADPADITTLPAALRQRLADSLPSGLTDSFVCAAMLPTIA